MTRLYGDTRCSHIASVWLGFSTTRIPMWLGKCSVIAMSRILTLLLVEDDPTLGPLTAEALRQFGHHVALAPSVDMAFGWMKASNECDAIVLDLDVGDEPGELLIERLLDASMHVPEVLVVSAQPINVLARVVERLDACTCLQKPCTARAINAELERCVRA